MPKNKTELFGDFKNKKMYHQYQIRAPVTKLIENHLLKIPAEAESILFRHFPETTNIYFNNGEKICYLDSVNKEIGESIIDYCKSLEGTVQIWKWIKQNLLNRVGGSCRWQNIVMD